MFEELGLGVRLTFEDDFSDKSGNALKSFSDLETGITEASSKIQKQMVSLQNVMLSGFSLTQEGIKIESLGKKAMGAVAGIQKEIINVSSSFETIQKQMLTSFSGNAQQMEDAFKWVQDFAVKTPFQVENTARALSSLRMVGVDVRQTFKDINGETKPFLQFLGDLATKNMSSTGGIEGMMIAMNNAFSGQWTSLQKRFDIPKSDIEKLKELEGDTSALMQGVVDLANKYTPNAMQNLVGTWDETLSEMQDNWRNFLFNMGQGGVFDSAKKSLHKISVALGDIMSPKLIESLRGSFEFIWKPIDRCVDGLIALGKGLAKIQENHPIVSKLLVSFVALNGVLAYTSGWIMKVAGNFLILFASFASLRLNLMSMALDGITVGSIFSSIGTKVFALAKHMSILGILGLGMFSAWKNDIGGVQTRFTELFSSIKSGWALAQQSMKSGLSMSDLTKKYNFKTRIKLPPLAEMFGKKFLKVIALSKAFWQVITGHFENGVMKFSAKDWKLFQDTGIDGFVRKLVYARDKVDYFFKGFGEGLSTVYGMMSEFANIVWTPIKAVIDSVKKHIDKNPKGLLGKLVIGEDGVAIEQAERARQVAERLGKAIGGVVGVLASFKAISVITSVISKPFKSLNNTLAKTGSKLSNILTKLHLLPSKKNIDVSTSTSKKGLGGLTSKVAGTRTGKYFSTVGKETRELVGRYDRTTPIRKGRAFKDGRYRRVPTVDVDPEYNKHFINPKMGNGEELQVKRRSRLGKTLFGESYYAKDSDGNRRKLGHYGGLMHMRRDDKNMANKITSISGQYDNIIQGNDKFSRSHRLSFGSQIGKVSDMKGYSAKNTVNMARVAEEQQKASGISRSVKGLSNSQFDRFSSVRQKEIGLDYSNLNNNRGNLNKKEQFRLDTYNRLGIDDNNLTGADKILKADKGGQRVLGGLKSQRANRILQADTGYSEARKNASKYSGNSAVYADNKRSGLTRALFGQRLYSVEEDGKGNYKKRTVGRKGGIFRKEKNDGLYKPRKMMSERVSGLGKRMARSSAIKIDKLTTPISNTKLGGAIAEKMSKLSSGSFSKTASKGAMGMWSVGARVSNSKPVTAMKNSFVGRQVSKLRGGGIGNWYDKQRERVGLAPRVPQVGKKQNFAMRATKGTGKFLFGSTIRDGEGNKVGRRQGFIARTAQGTARGARGIGRGIGRGVGFMGRTAMRAMPAVALGGMAFKGISNRGKGMDKDQRKKLGVKDGASDFQAGLKSMQKQVSSMNLAKVWKDFKKEGGDCFKIVGDIAKDVFGQLKANLPQILSGAWQGIKGMASIAWTFIKTDGITILGDIGQSIMSLLGKAWEWVATNGGEMLGKVANFTITVVIPNIIQGVVQLGVFIITHIPQVLKGLMGIAIGIFQGILEGVKNIFSGIASFLWECFTNALSGLGEIILSAIATPIRAIPVIGDKVANVLGLPAHHGGLWMSQDEHMAVIKKDETVLPPDKSRKLAQLLNNDAPIGGGGGGNTPKNIPRPTSVDNSISIDKVEIVVKADKLSQSDARKQAMQILTELKKLSKEKQIRNFDDIDGSLAF